MRLVTKIPRPRDKAGGVQIQKLGWTSDDDDGDGNEEEESDF